VEAVILERGTERAIAGEGRGPIEAFVDALRSGVEVELQVLDYHEHALGQGADAAAVAYVEVKSPEGVALFGVGRDDDIVTASLRAVVSALNRCCV
jgi:2-isopropylmalate synthase